MKLNKGKALRSASLAGVCVLLVFIFQNCQKFSSKLGGASAGVVAPAALFGKGMILSFAKPATACSLSVAGESSAPWGAKVVYVSDYSGDTAGLTARWRGINVNVANGYSTEVITPQPVALFLNNGQASLTGIGYENTNPIYVGHYQRYLEYLQNGEVVCTTGTVASQFLAPGNVALLPQSQFSSFSEGRIFQRAANNLSNFSLQRQQAEPAQAYRKVFLIGESNEILNELSSEQAPFTNQIPINVATGMNRRRLRVSYYDAAATEQARWVSPGFSVGEVFIVAGQSNSATHGQVHQVSQVSLNRAVDPSSNTWLPLNDPMPMATSWASPQFGSNAESGGSPWPSFADSLSADLGVPVGVISVGVGSTAIEQWQKSDPQNLYGRLLLAAGALPDCSFRAVLWHQGESDSTQGTSTQDYVNRMNSIRANFQADTNCRSQKWIIAQAAWLPPEIFASSFPQLTNASIAAVANAQIQLMQSPGYAAGPNTDQWTDYPTLRFDHAHFTAWGLALHGQAWRSCVRGIFGL